MIVWRGLGFLPIFILFGSCLVVWVCGGKDSDLYMPLSLILAAISSWFAGKKLNSEDNIHTLFWIPMQYWAFILGGFGLWGLIALL